ncbi:response regulator [bacterium]|nr:response regulator [bacterium]
MSSHELRIDGFKILVVDDAPDNRLLVSRFLNLAGATVETATDGPEGIGAALAANYDAILMDIQMPGMDGYEAVERLRAHRYVGPIVALTAHAMKSEKSRCLASGFDDYLTKPISRIHLLQTLIRVVHAKRAESQALSAIQRADIQPDPEMPRGPQEERQIPDRKPDSPEARH